LSDVDLLDVISVVRTLERLVHCPGDNASVCDENNETEENNLHFLPDGITSILMRLDRKQTRQRDKADEENSHTQLEAGNKRI
jgi:hypothetical protein